MIGSLSDSNLAYRLRVIARCGHCSGPALFQLWANGLGVVLCVSEPPCCIRYLDADAHPAANGPNGSAGGAT